ncbi:MAG: hypothetical protein N3D80_05460 [Ignavibacterium album]|jgi:hypothetical protein|uniref:hypothetical protein n=1 Tax=Ignavibacterium album TaxID=591197 RepID=UPI0026EC72DC|nr:hypothetical protein [Ignavibacterium album]MCX8105307.1 hypothetical protein [Ignavibacterium album]
MKAFLRSLQFLLIIFLSCKSESTHNVLNETKLFSDFLAENFNITISNNKHYYILVSSFGCFGCKEKNIRELDSFINKEAKNIFTIISNDNSINYGNLIYNTNFYKDSRHSLDKFKVNVANVTLIEVKYKKVTLIKTFNPEDPPITDFIKLH